MSVAVSSEVAALSPFLERLRKCGLGRTVVLHSGQRRYVGKLLSVSAGSLRLEAESDEFDELCELRVDPTRIEAFEVF